MSSTKPILVLVVGLIIRVIREIKVRKPLRFVSQTITAELRLDCRRLR